MAPLNDTKNRPLYGSQTTNCFVTHDGNGNVMALINTADGTFLANYDYGPFGEVLRTTGPIANSNPFGFSTKYQDDESGLYAYALRYLNTPTGGWLSRDPVGEGGGRNLYCFVGNCPVVLFDPDGRMSLRIFEWQLPRIPTNGPYTNADGLTWFNIFDPRATVYSSTEAPCCSKIFLPGHADIYSWWVVNSPVDQQGLTAQGHELVHVALHKQTYDDFNADAADYVGPCFSKCKANCYKDVINGPMKAAWLAFNNVINLQFDCSAGQQDRCDQLSGAQQQESAAWQALEQAEAGCGTLQ
jgi:RHS repeat-associated protein